jgi:GNAT superfamily N-acetyltransferase
VRLATPQDCERVAWVLRAAFAEFEPLYTRAGFEATTPSAHEVARRLAAGPIWVATDGDAAVGTVSALDRGDDVYVRGLAVVAAARGHGIAPRLLDTVQTFAHRLGRHRLCLSTTPFLFASIRLYQRAGFRQLPDPLDLHGTPLIAMEKDLTADETHAWGADWWGLATD